MNLDNTDIEILRLLQEDSRTSYREIANKLGLSVGTVHNRVKRLTSEGIIKSFSTILDPEKLGFELTAIILMQVEGAHIVDVEKALARSPPVIAVYDITGDFDIVIIAKFRGRAELNKFIKDVLRMPHVKRSVTSIALNVVKEDVKLSL
ncbi:MAG: Lrp/AsnC family transcriptional regulator [Candidatus Verstraetearchaeota archaeon]|jgi:DNA-binding Lrp family transcriptional regulator|uniref:AsnC family transcriptional regulator n=1 Tax=Thermoproteota archaeon TaxID=2056631 RepID=A0A523BA22_9CREN|nr:Lrp/AsnC family transcriptional regulator [Candidatus Methanomethylicia archaeon]NHV60524.1 Lrp/AsnC family transcriptional regulator [Candidatus Verstraetearchaeota archaeon]TDA37797.1 MAG: AsnC family transcriptional regulator [Candidatus Verstraetearchaeota archaeon]